MAAAFPFPVQTASVSAPIALPTQPMVSGTVTMPPTGLSPATLGLAPPPLQQTSVVGLPIPLPTSAPVTAPGTVDAIFGPTPSSPSQPVASVPIVIPTAPSRTISISLPTPTRAPLTPAHVMAPAGVTTAPFSPPLRDPSLTPQIVFKKFQDTLTSPSADATSTAMERRMETKIPHVWLNEFRKYIYNLLGCIEPSRNSEIRRAMVNPKHLPIWAQAFCHETFKFRLSYETLETLGDAVAGYAFKQYLLSKDPKSTPGTLSALTQLYMSKNQQPEIARSFKMTDWILQDPVLKESTSVRVDRSIEETTSVRVRRSIEEDVFEAFCGALDVVSRRVRSEFLDRGDHKNALGCMVGDAATIFLKFYFDAHPVDFTKRFGNAKNAMNEYSQFFIGNLSGVLFKGDRLTFTPQFIEAVNSYNPKVAQILSSTPFLGDDMTAASAALAVFDANRMDIAWRKNMFESLSFRSDSEISSILRSSGYGRFFIHFGNAGNQLYGILVGNYSSAREERVQSLHTEIGNTHEEIKMKLRYWLLTNGATLRVPA